MSRNQKFHNSPVAWTLDNESANGGRLRRRGSHGQIAVEQSRHAVPPSACRECLAEMWRAALERGARPPRDMRACVAKVNHSLRFCPG